MPKYSNVSNYHIELPNGTSIPSPLAIAEQLTHDEAWLLNKDPARHGPLQRRFEDGWTHLEAGLCLSRTSRKIAALSRAATIFADLQENSPYYETSAGTVLDFMPVFEYRAKNEAYPADALRLLSRQLGSRALALATAEDINKFGSIYETLFLSLSASAGDPQYLAFPASVREQASSPRAKNFNHDAYVIRSKKIPLQLKSSPGNHTESKYQPGVFKLNVRSLLFRAAVDVYGQERWDARRRSTNNLYSLPIDKMHRVFQLTSELLITEAEGHALNEQDTQYTTLLRERLAARIDTAQQKQDQGLIP